MEMPVDVAGPERASLLALFGEFLKVSLCSVGGGGGIVWARRVVVERRGWMNDRDFADVLSLCQFMPGPNVVGITVCVGSRLRGPKGALAGVAGFTVIPLAISFSLGTWYLANTDIAALQGVLGGVSAAAAGLMIATGLRLLLPWRQHPSALALAALAFAGLVFTSLPLLAVLLVLAPLGVGVAVLAGGRRR